MKTKILYIVPLLVLFIAVFSFAQDEEVVEHDRAIISLFVQPGMSFLGFDDRDKFQTATDSIFKDLKEEARTEEESLAVSRQTYQKVNMAFPITAGIQIQTFEDQFLSAGIGFVYDNEEVVLTDRLNKTHSYNYTLQAVPFYLEYRIAISKNFMTVSGESLFSFAARWYWMLPGTEIYSSWGRLEAKNDPLGCGFGFSLGYLIGAWKNFKVYGDLGYSSISLESDDSFAKIVPLYDEPDKETGKSEADKKAKWDLGGLQFQIRVSFGVWNKPVIKEQADSARMSLGSSRTGRLKGDSTSASAMPKESSEKLMETSPSDSQNIGKSLTVENNLAKQDAATQSVEQDSGVNDSLETAPEQNAAPVETAPAENSSLENSASEKSTPITTGTAAPVSTTGP